MPINPHIERLFHYVEAGKPPKDNVQQVPFTIGIVKFSASYHIIDDGKAITDTLVPGTKLRMPVIAALDIPTGGFKPDQGAVLDKMTQEAQDKIKEMGVFCYCTDLIKGKFVDHGEVKSHIGKVQANGTDVPDGLWFTKGGVGFKIGNEDNAPALYLSRYAKTVISHYPDIIRWVAENPPPKGQLDSILNWYRKLGAKFIEDGWHLLWRGVLYTGEHIDRVSSDFNELEDNIKEDVMKWPDDTRIDAFKIWSGSKFQELSWKEFKGIKSDAPHKVEEIFRENLQSVYQHYRNIIDRVIQHPHGHQP